MQVTAISQYDHYCIYPNLLGMKEELQSKILGFWEKVHPLVGTESYVIDFAYIQSRDSMVVIELSPFLPCTGAALFSWMFDRKILENGPLEFRIKESHHHLELNSLIEANWENRWMEIASKYWEFYHLAKEDGETVGFKSIVSGTFESLFKT